LVNAVLVLCIGLTVYKGLKEAGVKPGEEVTIVRTGGGLGSIAIQYTKVIGLYIITVNSGEEEGESYKRLRAVSYMDFLKWGDIVEEVRKASREEGLGPHVVLLLAPSEKPFAQATQYIRPHGTVVRIKFVHLPTEHPLKRNKPNQGDAPPSPNIKQPPLDQFLFNSFPSFCSLLIFKMAISYTEEDLRKACDMAQQTRKLQSVAKK